MSQYPYASPSQLGVRPAVQLSAAFLTQAMFWMFIALLVTTGVGVTVANLPATTLNTLMDMWLFIVIGQLVLAFALTLGIRKMSPTLALLLFFVYSATMGITLGVILLTYELGSVLAAGASASAVFAGAAIYGAVTKRNLATMGGYLSMALIGLLVAMIVNIFIGWQTLNFIISRGRPHLHRPDGVGRQRISGRGGFAFTGSMEKSAVMGAFILYLDFVNLFFFLLRLFGGRD
jgi:FtsH-binding integral membrane protein